MYFRFFDRFEEELANNQKISPKKEEENNDNAKKVESYADLGLSEELLQGIKKLKLPKPSRETKECISLC